MLILKDHWGRPRPVMIDVFGGDQPYVAVWQITDFCSSNCSFVAGEASSAIWLAVALALVVPAVARRRPSRRRRSSTPLLLSLNRIAFGGHFLVRRPPVLGIDASGHGGRLAVDHRKPAQWLANERLDAGLTRAGSASADNRAEPIGMERRLLPNGAGFPALVADESDEQEDEQELTARSTIGIGLMAVSLSTGSIADRRRH